MNDNSLKKLIESLKLFPGITFKQAEKIAFFIISQKKGKETLEKVFSLANTIEKCEICGTFKKIGTQCSNCSKDFSSICVVETIADKNIIEKSESFKGSFHILGGVISPLENIMPEQLLIEPLFQRIKKGINEIIFALPSTIEGDATIEYIADKLSDFNVKISKIATGIPRSSKIDSMDRKTIADALNERKDITNQFS
jgi:recombination protein RecR